MAILVWSLNDNTSSEESPRVIPAWNGGSGPQDGAGKIAEIRIPADGELSHFYAEIADQIDSEVSFVMHKVGSPDPYSLGIGTNDTEAIDQGTTVHVSNGDRLSITAEKPTGDDGFNQPKFTCLYTPEV